MGNQSCQIIIPQKQLKRQSDVFISMVETENPEQEIVPALRLLGRIEEQFVSVSELFAPTDDGTADGVFVTESYDPLSHFESATDDVLRLWRQISGEDLNLNLTPEEMADDQ